MEPSWQLESDGRIQVDEGPGDREVVRKEPGAGQGRRDANRGLDQTVCSTQVWWAKQFARLDSRAGSP